MKTLSHDSLNRQQREAAEVAEGHNIIVAGPGTGKTMTFAHRTAYLLKERHISGKNILTVTFTRSAAQEMYERLHNLLSATPFEKELEEVWVDTFHAVALRMLREQNYPFGPNVDWSVIDEEEKRTFLKDLVPAKNYSQFLEETRRQKQNLVIPNDNISQAYQKKLWDTKRLDFDDLFLYVFRMFEERPEIQERYQRRFRYILVDEFQDTSAAQYKFMSYLISHNVCVFGDPDQAIYGFQSDSFLPFEQFKQDYPEHRILSLSENYRSQSTIIKAAKQVIDKNPVQLPRELTARLEQGLPIEISSYQTDLQEAEMVVRKIEGLIGGSAYFAIDSQWAERENESSTYSFQDIAVFYRFHTQAKQIEKVLERAGLPYRTFAKRSQKNQQHLPLKKFNEGAVPLNKYFKKKGQGEFSLSEDLEDYKNDEEGLRGEDITLMTLHRSKGLEFPVVFILGCEDGVLPYYDSGNPSEERRLFYVGITRAKNRLFLSYAKRRFLFGKTIEPKPSPFLLDIEEELRILQQSFVLAKKRYAKSDQLTLFE